MFAPSRKVFPALHLVVLAFLIFQTVPIVTATVTADIIFLLDGSVDTTGSMFLEQLNATYTVSVLSPSQRVLWVGRLNNVNT